MPTFYCCSWGDAGYMVLTEPCTNGTEALGRKTHFTPEWLFANWNWCFFVSKNSGPERLSLPKISPKWFYILILSSISYRDLRLHLHQVIYFLNFILLTFRTVLKPILRVIYMFVCVRVCVCVCVYYIYIYTHTYILVIHIHTFTYINTGNQ